MVYLDQINEAVKTDAPAFVKTCEQEYNRRLNHIAREILLKNARIIMLAGPSSSGKTTSAQKLTEILTDYGHFSCVISLDDFYRGRDDILNDPNGNTSFEDPEALNLSLLHDTFYKLAAGESVMLPEYDFEKGVRHDNVQPFKMLKDSVIVVEGLHALNPIVTHALPEELLARVYISLGTDIGRYRVNDRIFFARREVRFLRRMIRDYNFRASSVPNTLSLWPEVLEGEERNLFPFIEEADHIVETLLPYEICAYKEPALKLISEVHAKELQSEDQDFLSILAEKLEFVEALPSTLVPVSSLLNEFLV